MGYSSLAKYYDKFMEDFPYTMWGEFIVSKIDVSQPILELACGTGNLTIELHNRGLIIDGSDIDEKMLAIAKEKAIQDGCDIDFYMQDMLKADLRGYGSVICPCDGINSLLSEGEIRSFFKNIAKTLSGTLIFDFSTREKLSSLHNEIYYEDYEDVTYFWQSEYNQGSDEVNLYLTFFEKLKNGYYNREDLIITQKGLSIQQIKSIVEECQYEIEGIYNDYTEEWAKENSQRVVFVCKINK